MLKYIWISTIVLLLTGSDLLLAQEQPDEVAEVEEIIPKEKYSYKPTAVRFGTNIFRLGRSAFDNEYFSWDVSGDIDFHKYLLEVSYGRESNQLDAEGFDYENSGSFFRIGADVNFIKDKTEANALVLGLKYVTGSYTEDFKFNDLDTLFGPVEKDVTNSALKPRWLEANVGLKIKMWQQLYIGFYFRYRFNRVVTGDREFGTYRIPGYGLEERRNLVGFDYYVFWRIPFKKSPKILSP